MGLFERYLSVWVGLGILAGVGLGLFAPGAFQAIAGLEFAQVNLVVAVFIWVMIYPMMIQIDWHAVKDVGRKPQGLILTLVVNWLIKPFTMAALGVLFFQHLFAPWVDPASASEYIAGMILLGVAPCTAMVFVWSQLVKGDPNYTLVQVSVNDLILLIAFIPIVRLLLGITDIPIPWDVLAASVVTFVVIPLIFGYLSNRLLLRFKGKEWFKEVFLHRLKPVSIIALLTTLVLLFAFQGDTILNKPVVILLIAIPLTLQTYFIFFLTWFAGRFLKLRHAVCAPAAMIGASNFFELAVAVAISLFGLNSGASLATVVGVLIEVPVMLSLVAMANKWRY